MRPHTTKDVRKLLKAMGCNKVAVEGSHEKWETPGGLSNTIVAGEKQQSPGLLRRLQATFASEFGDKWLEKALEPERTKNEEREDGDEAAS